MKYTIENQIKEIEKKKKYVPFVLFFDSHYLNWLHWLFSFVEKVKLKILAVMS